MCPELVSTESKKIEKYIRGFPERIKGNITSSKPATLHEAINMARELDKSRQKHGTIRMMELEWEELTRSAEESFQGSQRPPTEWLRGLERHFEQRDDGEIYFFNRIWIPSVGGVRKLIMDEAYNSALQLHLGADKM
ncbi:hypothetical protein Tco_1185358 [Tanacetum coccineum]